MQKHLWPQGGAHVAKGPCTYTHTHPLPGETEKYDLMLLLHSLILKTQRTACAKNYNRECYVLFKMHTIPTEILDEYEQQLKNA